MAPDNKAERRVWDLLTRDFRWVVPADFPVQVYDPSGTRQGAARLQVFEVAIARIFAKLRPEYHWRVTQNQPDGGLDFVGEHAFLHDETLGITAAITVGGQCKKRTTVGDIVDEVAGSLTRMAKAHKPTFFVVAFSARLSQDRVKKARTILEDTFRRHCHILDRNQIEGLMCDHLALLDEILRECLTKEEIQEVRSYFENRRGARLPYAITLDTPVKVLAGVPFRVVVRIRSSIVCGPPLCLWWRPIAGPDAQPVQLIGPIGADLPIGVDLKPDDTVDDPIYSRCSIELASYSVGRVDLGEVLIGSREDGPSEPAARALLGAVQVIENVRPRFFDPPFRAGMTRLAQAYERALSGAVVSVGVVGAGGSGKSRLCEEFSLERRRRGAWVISAKQAKTFDDPYRILANLFFELADDDVRASDPADRVVETISLYDSALARTAGSTIRSMFGAPQGVSGTVSERAILSSAVLLIVARARRLPLVVHFQDLHWCSPDVLSLIERLVWRFDQPLAPSGAMVRSSPSRIVFIFEGRVRERGEFGKQTWTSEPFEAFLQKLDCPAVHCSSFAPDDGLSFTRRLFEDRHSARRLVSNDLLELQEDLMKSIHRTAGGNPFHTLQQVQLLKERRIVGQNPETGLLFMIQPGDVEPTLPATVFESIRLRWQYLNDRSPELALLLWAAARVEEGIPRQLFHHLWRGLAPHVDLNDVDATDCLWTGNERDPEVGFRHENYFQSFRRFEMASEDRERVVAVYSDWYGSAPTLGPNDQFKWARVLLEHPRPDVTRVGQLFDLALGSARRLGDVKLARRISAAALDLAWSEDALSPVWPGEFVDRCDEELELVRDLLGSDRLQASRRLENLRNRLQRRLSTVVPAETLGALELRQLTAEVIFVQFLFNDRQPVLASEVAGRALRDIRERRSVDSTRDAAAWDALAMEALGAHAVALALSGEIGLALEESDRAVDIAQRSSSPLARHVISTHANILLATDPGASEVILRQCLADTHADNGHRDPPNDLEINLSMALVLRAHRLGDEDATVAASLLDEAARRLSRVFRRCFPLGNFPDAAAAALMRGIVSVLAAEHDEVRWFASAVAAASRGRQMETLWRAHINLAQALHGTGEVVSTGPYDHARAAFDILEETLSPYSEPDRSPRFRLTRVPLAHAVRFLILAGAEAGLAALERYPGLRACFSDPTAGILRDDRGGYSSHEWLRFGDDDYVIY